MPTAPRTTLLTTLSTRRQLLSQGALACLTFGLSQTLWTHELFAEPKSAEFERWLAGLLATGERLKKGEITTEQWQSAMEVLYGSVSLNDLRIHIDFDKMTEDFDFSELGEKLVDLNPLSGEPFSDPLPGRDRVMTKLGGVRRGKNVPPHGHENMTSAFLVLHGEFHLRQYDKLRTNDESLVIRKSRDETQNPGDWSSVSDSVRNMHWLHANSGDAFFFSTKLIYIVAHAPMKGRIYVDLRQPRDLGAGNIEASIISHNRAQEIYNDT